VSELINVCQHWLRRALVHACNRPRNRLVKKVDQISQPPKRQVVVSQSRKLLRIAPPHVQLWTIFKGCFPFLIMVFISMILVYIFPKIVFWLPEQLYGN
jgi:hypothetical protein